MAEDPDRQAGAAAPCPPPAATTVIDARGTLCPVPIIRLARAAGAGQAGDLVELLSDDPAAEHDVPAWCHLRGHELLAASLRRDPGQPGCTSHLIRLGR